MFALSTLTGEAPAVPLVQVHSRYSAQSGNPPEDLYDIEQPDLGQPVFNIRLYRNPVPRVPSGGVNCEELGMGFTILPGAPNEIIGSLLIERPLEPLGPGDEQLPEGCSGAWASTIAVAIGDLNGGFPRFARVDSTDVLSTPGGHGIVQMSYNYVGAVGTVTGINRLFAFAIGDVVGPIVCQTHVASGEQPEVPGYDCYVDIRSNGNLRGDVAILPVPDEALPARGIIQRLDFPGGTIGRDDNNDGTLDGPVNILADEIVESVYANEAWANIRGTGTLVRPNNDTFVERLGYIDTSDYATAAGGITAALIQMGYESIESFSDALAHMTPEQQTAEMRTLGGLLPGGQE